jgi:GR25 family glycosyltransferase involved in LPS biosynthesis
MKSYIIRLIEFDNSVKWADETFNSAKKHNWDINYFEGINGLKYSLDNFNIKPNLKFKKGARYLEKPGVVGCFLSHYSLWKKSISLNESVCILEHDATVISKFPQIQITDVLKFVKGADTKPIYIGKWWASGAAYCVTPQGAKKLVDFTHTIGAMPADIMLNTGIVDIKFYENIVNVNQNEYSFTRNLKK